MWVSAPGSLLQQVLVSPSRQVWLMCRAAGVWPSVLVSPWGVLWALRLADGSGRLSAQVLRWERPLRLVKARVQVSLLAGYPAPYQR